MNVRELVFKIFMIIGTTIISLSLFQLTIGFSNEFNSTGYTVDGQRHMYSEFKDKVGTAVINVSKITAMYYTDIYGYALTDTSAFDDATTVRKVVTCN